MEQKLLDELRQRKKEMRAAKLAADDQRAAAESLRVEIEEERKTASMMIEMLQVGLAALCSHARPAAAACCCVVPNYCMLTHP